MLLLCVRREALFDHMEVRDRPSVRCRGSGLELEVPDPGIAGEGGSSLDEVVSAW